jgi:hypothetical protein
MLVATEQSAWCLHRTGHSVNVLNVGVGRTEVPRQADLYLTMKNQDQFPFILFVAKIDGHSIMLDY